MKKTILILIIFLLDQTKVWWLCKNNHEWQTSVHHRTTRGTKCALVEEWFQAQIRLYCELKTILLDLEFRQFIDKIECDILERKVN